MPLIGTGTGTAFQQGTAASRPAASTANAGFYYFATDTYGGTLYQSTGSAWVQMAPGVVSGLVQIAQTVLTGTASSITFSSIPGTYSVLRLVMYTRFDVAGGAGALMRLNSDSGANYDEGQFQMNTASSAFFPTLADTSARVITGCYSTAPANAFNSGYIEIPAYAGTTGHKAWHGQASHKDLNTTGGIYGELFYGWWRSTAAITSITLLSSAGNYVAGTAMTLYGLA